MAQKNPGVSYCKVLDVKDDQGRGQILVAPFGAKEDGDKNFYAFPLLPKVFHVKPKVNEGVFIFHTDGSDEQSPAYYIGPIISQEHKLINESADNNPAMKAYKEGSDVNPYLIDHDNVKKILPRDEDVVVRGRKSAEMQFTDDDVRIKAGIRKITADNQYLLTFNQKNPAFIKMKYHYTPLDNRVNSTATIVADKINLLSTHSNDKPLGNIDPDELITDEKLNEVLKDYYRIPYGEKLVKLLSVFIDAFITHTHSYVMRKPVIAGTRVPELLAEKAELLDSQRLLSDGIRIN